MDECAVTHYYDWLSGEFFAECSCGEWGPNVTMVLENHVHDIAEHLGWPLEDVPNYVKTVSQLYQLEDGNGA